MFRLLLPVIVVLGLFYYWKLLKHASPEERSRRLKGIASLAAMLVASTFAVRGGSWGWAVGGLLAIAALRAIPYLSKGVQAQDEANAETRKSASNNSVGPMTRAEAMRILDISEPFSSEHVHARYREVMRAVHPDRGGSTHLAAQVNEAYRVLSGPPNGRKSS